MSGVNCLMDVFCDGIGLDISSSDDDLLVDPMLAFDGGSQADTSEGLL